MPFVSSLLMKYGQSESNSDLKIAVQISAIIIFMASFMEFTAFVVALWNPNKMLHQNIFPDIAPLTHNYFVSKAMVIPILSLISFYSGLSTNFVAYVVHHVCIFVAPLIFMILKVFFNRYQRNAPMTLQTLNPKIEEIWNERTPLVYKRKS